MRSIRATRIAVPVTLKACLPLPMFRIVDHNVYPTRFHPDGETTEPWFTMRGSMVYPANGHPGGASHAPRYASAMTRGTTAS